MFPVWKAFNYLAQTTRRGQGEEAGLAGGGPASAPAASQALKSGLRVRSGLADPDPARRGGPDVREGARDH